MRRRVNKTGVKEVENNLVRRLLAAALVAAISACGNGSAPAESSATQHRQAAAAAARTPSAYTSTVQQLYIAYFGRPADPGGLANFSAALANLQAPVDLAALDAEYDRNGAVRDLVDQFGTSDESKSLYTGDAQAFIRAIYHNVLGREPDADGLAFWSAAVASGALSKGKAAISIMAGALSNVSPQGLLDAQTVTNKVAVGADFTALVQVDAYKGDAAAALARTMLATVDNATNATAFRFNIDGAVAALAAGITSAPSPAIALTVDIPELVRLSYQGVELTGRTTISVPVGTKPLFAFKVHPGFAWAGGSGVPLSVNGNTLSASEALVADRVLVIASPTVSDTSRSILYAASYSRSATYRDELGTTATTIEVFAALASNHKLVLTYAGLDPVTKLPVTRDLTLLDDGAGSDKKAGDHRYTAALRSDLLPYFEYMGVAAHDGRVHVVDAQGNDVPSAGQVKTGMSLVVVERAKTPAITKVADDVYASDHVVNVVVHGTSLRFNGDYVDADFARPAFRRLLAFWPDVFDHASFFYAGNVGPNIGSEFSYRLNSTISGIGNYAFTMAPDIAQFGSATLDSASQLTGGTTGPYMHEFTHRWGFYLNDARLPLAENTSCACHFDLWNQIIWDPISAGGGMGITQLPGGAWVLDAYHGTISYQHSDIMLYLAGLIAPAELAPMPWVTNALGKLPQGQAIAASYVTTVSAADIEAVYGKRIPAYGAAPTIFRDAIVLITADRPALPEEMAVLEEQAKFYASRGTSSANIVNAGWQNGLAFYDSTKGRGTLITQLPPRR